MKQFLMILFMLICIIQSINAQDIKVNQIGFYKQAQKIAVVTETTETTFSVIDQISGLEVYNGNLSAPQSWSNSGESNIKTADFSDLKTVGSYYIKSGEKKSHVFQIAEKNLFKELTTWSVKAFYLWRASTAIEKEYATFNDIDFSRAAGHLDTAVLIHASAASALRPTGTVLSSSKGWYDAGDYNKYVVNANPAVFTMLHAYECFPDYFKKQNLNIPESSNTLPDILDEVKWETDWLLTMQDPNDGGVYTKLTDAAFTAMVMPDKAPQGPRYLVTKSTAATLDFAAMMAKSSRVFREFETLFPGYADSCLKTAKKAMEWAKANPAIYFTNPSGISTGGYGDSNVKDEFFWAQIELFLATNNISYLESLPTMTNFDSPQWPNVQTNGLLSLMNCIDTVPMADSLKSIITQSFYTMADRMVSQTEMHPYKIGINNFFWGSNGSAAGIGMVAASAYHFSKDEKYLNTAIAILDYLLGRNATPYCFVTGFGDVSPMNIHDRRAESDGIVASLPGYLVGGPNAGNQSADCGTAQYPSTYGAKSYLDRTCSYSTNEIAINWNGPFVFLTGAIEAIYSSIKMKPTFIGSDTTGAIIRISYPENLAAFDTEKVSYSIKANDIVKEIDSITFDSNSENTILIFLRDSIKSNETTITINSEIDSVISINATQISTLQDQIIINNVIGAAPVVIGAETSADGNSIILTLNKKIIDFDTLRNDFKVYVNSSVVSKYAVIDSVSDMKIIIATEQIYLYDFVGVSYTGTTITSNEGGIMQDFDVISVKNTAPERPSTLMSASANEDGYTLTLTFDKAIKIGTGANKLLVEYENSSNLSEIEITSITVLDAIVTVKLSERFTSNDSVFISSIADGILTLSGDPILSFTKFIASNSLPKEQNYVIIDSLSSKQIEIEAYAYNNGFVKEPCSDTGGGLNVGYTDKGDWLDYLIDVKHAGTYTISVRVASQLQKSEIIVQTYNGISSENLNSISTPNTGGWQKWQTVLQLIKLETGKQTIRIFVNNNYVNLNWIQLEYGEHLPTNINQVQKSSFNLFPNPSESECYIKVASDSDIVIDNIIGVHIASFNIKAGETQKITLKQGVYIVKSGNEQKQLIVK
ncbi:MAG: glycoside hydrolase family 9 protein [Bacteroidales bacterium]|nr:glycoside hydrolase family 9 protein [Bacteroidales bacterium]